MSWLIMTFPTSFLPDSSPPTWCTHALFGQTRPVNPSSPLRQHKDENSTTLSPNPASSQLTTSSISAVDVGRWPSRQCAKRAAVSRSRRFLSNKKDGGRKRLERRDLLTASSICSAIIERRRRLRVV